SQDAIDWDVVREEANVCDQLMPKAGGGTVKRYELCGFWEMSPNGIKTALSGMMAALDATYYQSREGKFAFKVGRWIAPTLTLDKAKGHIESVRAQLGTSAIMDVDALKVIYTDHSMNDTETDTSAIVSSGGLLAADNRTQPAYALYA